LKTPATIGRAVVAMLNSQTGGVIWIGVSEEAGTAKSIEAVENPKEAARELTDHLIDTLEPSPAESEVKVEDVKLGSLGSILRIKVSPNGDRRPYSQIVKGGRHFTIRVGDRVRPMSREEITQDFTKTIERDQPDEDAVMAVGIQLQHERNNHWLQSDGTIWFRIQPVDALKINVHEDETKKLLRDPRLSNNRPYGWNFTSRLFEPKHGQDRVFLKRGGRSKVEIVEDGGLLLVEELGRLQWKGNEKEIYPWVLLELPTSFLRLAAVLYRKRLEDMGETKVLADFALFGIKGWSLSPGSPDTPRYELVEPEPYEENNNFVLTTPLVFSLKDVVNDPDRCAYRIIRLVYLEFGLDEDDIPRAYDRQAGKLVIPR
jgi:hypothetical protein